MSDSNKSDLNKYVDTLAVVNNDIANKNLVSFFTDLDALIDSASPEIKYSAEEKGFILENDAVYILYARNFLGMGNQIDMWILQADPKAMMRGCFLYDKGQRYMTCHTLGVHKGEPYDVLSPVSQTVSFIDVVSGADGKTAWFEKGQRLMEKIAEKYRLEHWHRVYAAEYHVQAYGHAFLAQHLSSNV